MSNQLSKSVNTSKDRPALAWLVHGLRVAMLLLIAWGMKCLATQRQAQSDSVSDWAEITPGMLARWIPEADRIEAASDAQSLAQAKDTMGRVVGYVGLTQPQAARVIGYRGPSNALLIFDAAAQKLVGVELLESRDTPEHVNHVLANEKFFEQFKGWTWSAPPANVDAVSGATLTSLAIAEGVIVRLGGKKPHLRFPNPVKLEEIQAWVPNAAGLGSDDSGRELVDSSRVWILDAQGSKLGWVLRTGTLVENLEGYQGPTEVLMWFDLEDRLQRAKLRHSYDNEPYVTYVQDESSFWKRFRGLTIQQLASFDRQAEGVDGVSGATMTSQTVVDTMAAAAKQYLESLHAESSANSSASSQGLNFRWTWNDVGTAAVILFALLISSTKLRGKTRFMTLWSWVLILYFGLCTGNLVSQALLVGWASAGVPWRLAPGLVCVVCLALLWPPVSKQNIYCNHLCPHGAAQRLVKGRLKSWKVPVRVSQLLKWLPGTLLITIMSATLADRKWNIANFEPFDAYVWAVAGLVSLVLAIASLTISAKIPMAYCKFGCPTGRLLEYTRRTRQSHRWIWQDGVCALIAVTVWGLFLAGYRAM